MDRILAAAFVVLVSTAIIGFSTGNTGASFTASTTNPGESWNTQNVTPPASFTSATPKPAGQIDLVWTASASPAGGHTLTYLVLRGAVGGPYAQVGSTAALTYSDTPPADGTYEYVIQTKIAQGGGFFTSGNSAAKSSLSDRTAPTAASGILTAKGAIAGQITITWTAGTDGGTGVSGYTIHYTNALGGGGCPAQNAANFPNATGVGAVTSTTVGGLVSGSKYCFYFVTADVAGNLSVSSASAGPQAAK
jgi:hypothetical protein